MSQTYKRRLKAFMCLPRSTPDVIVEDFIGEFEDIVRKMERIIRRQEEKMFNKNIDTGKEGVNVIKDEVRITKLPQIAVKCLRLMYGKLCPCHSKPMTENMLK
jgi:hypothetical protein